jgi:hypothetical protein
MDGSKIAEEGVAHDQVALLLQLGAIAVLSA